MENHYDIKNRYADRTGRIADDLLKQMTLENRKEKDGVYFPSANFNGIFLISHASAHFAGNHITLRHLLDWALFVDKEWKEARRAPASSSNSEGSEPICGNATWSPQKHLFQG